MLNFDKKKNVSELFSATYKIKIVFVISFATLVYVSHTLKENEICKVVFNQMVLEN
jgi:hypothetical protein